MLGVDIQDASRRERRHTFQHTSRLTGGPAPGQYCWGAIEHRMRQGRGGFM